MRPRRTETLHIHALYLSGCYSDLLRKDNYEALSASISGASSSNDIIDFPRHAGIAHFRIILVEITSQNRYANAPGADKKLFVDADNCSRTSARAPYVAEFADGSRRRGKYNRDEQQESRDSFEMRAPCIRNEPTSLVSQRRRDEVANTRKFAFRSSPPPPVQPRRN